MTSIMRAGEFLERVRDLGPFSDAAEAELAVRVTLEVAAEQLFEDEVHWLAGELPTGVGAGLRAGSRSREFDAVVLYQEVANRQRVPYGRALEHAQAVCRALGEALSPPARERLSKQLPELWELSQPRDPSEPPLVPEYLSEVDAREARGRTLAEGRPGAAHPLATARPEKPVHSHSVARSDEPHTDTKLSSSRGMTQEREGRTLADGRPGPTRPISGRR